MKKIILCLLLVGILLIMTSCNDNEKLDLTKLEHERYATLLMLDGSIIKGTCTNFLRYSDNWAYVKVNGTNYYLDTWRIILEEK